MIHEEYTNNFINGIRFKSTQEKKNNSAAEKRAQARRKKKLFENNLIKSHSFVSYSCFMTVEGEEVVCGPFWQRVLHLFFRLHSRKSEGEGERVSSGRISLKLLCANIRFCWSQEKGTFSG
jgi:hypothetical protein